MTEEKPLTLEDLTKSIREVVKEEFHRHDTPPAEKPKTEKPVHYTRTFDKFCPDCGSVNPGYEKPRKHCSDCDMPAQGKDKVCWNCGSGEFDEEEDDE